VRIDGVGYKSKVIVMVDQAGCSLGDAKDASAKHGRTKSAPSLPHSTRRASRAV